MEKQKPGVVNRQLLSLMAEMVLDEAITSYKVQNLYQQIDEALKMGDKESFQKLTDELKQVLPRKVN
ncbi:IDEAL domain-containing protein [Aneurinibacillus sp. Ricciae_BoGa-3]|uniref:IDEAL domain-containing protein n=1 Tax=Aneurinibacillus sp. Ricciae_BoGa-3 TaxID=3022697 RepID=UPI0023404E60|nr:IDEAL domain-containing protein [Aneurinibacillus sp. Ricciae_BoGa-3]WCK56097.1 IDEAL domain-containing protein [Aneurinibacillus sp. Ricciae_BoGa-3]